MGASDVPGQSGTGRPRRPHRPAATVPAPPGRVPILVVKERIDPVQTQAAPAAYVDEVQEDEDTLGVAQNHLSSVIPVKPGILRASLLPVVLYVLNLVARINGTHGELGGIPSIHFAHWSLIDGGRHLVFVSNYTAAGRAISVTSSTRRRRASPPCGATRKSFPARPSSPFRARPMGLASGNGPGPASAGPTPGTAPTPRRRCPSSTRTAPSAKTSSPSSTPPRRSRGCEACELPGSDPGATRAGGRAGPRGQGLRQPARRPLPPLPVRRPDCRSGVARPDRRRALHRRPPPTPAPAPRMWR